MPTRLRQGTLARRRPSPSRTPLRTRHLRRPRKQDHAGMENSIHRSPGCTRARCPRHPSRPRTLGTPLPPHPRGKRPRAGNFLLLVVITRSRRALRDQRRNGTITLQRSRRCNHARTRRYPKLRPQRRNRKSETPNHHQPVPLTHHRIRPGRRPCQQLARSTRPRFHTPPDQCDQAHHRSRYPPRRHSPHPRATHPHGD